MKKDINPIVPAPLCSIEDAVEEALLVGEFFDRIPRDEIAFPNQLPSNSPMADHFDHLGTALKYTDTSVSIEDLRLLEVYLNRRG